MVEQKNPVGILSGKREIVHDTQNCFGRLPAPAVDQGENVFLIEEIQMIGGLVQQKNIRVLSEHLGQESALEFASGECPHGMAAEAVHTGDFHGLQNLFIG